MHNQLTIIEKMGLSEGSTLGECERDIELARNHRELTYYVEGKRLQRIKEEEWYKECGTWSEYCEIRWRISRPHSYRLMKMANAVDNIKMSPMGDILPRTQKQVRPLIPLEPKQQIKAWQEAVETAQNGGKAPGISVAQEIKISGRHVQETVDRLYPKEIVDDVIDCVPRSCHNCHHCTTDSTDYDILWCAKLEKTMSLSSDYIPCDMKHWEVEKDEPEPALAVHFTSETPEWYTPTHIIDRVMKTMGDIDLDPCSNSAETPSVPAMSVFTKEDDGLSQEWFGRVYMNPPYGREIIDWIRKLVNEYETGNVKEAIALTPSRTDTEWFRLLKPYPRCFIWGRLHFSGADNAAPFPSMLVYLGDNLDNFNAAFNDIGDIYELR